MEHLLLVDLLYLVQLVQLQVVHLWLVLQHGRPLLRGVLLVGLLVLLHLALLPPLLVVGCLQAWGKQHMH
jgi:hypothetical protein